MRFPHDDSNWTEVIDIIKENNLVNIKTIAPVEFCNELDDCYPYEWSYWHDLQDYECIILHKGMYDRLKNDFLDKLEENYDYIFGNAVFNVYIVSSLNENSLKGHEVHFSLRTIIQSLKKILHIGKQFKAKASQKNILLVTANHCGNIGDDAITLASFDILQSVYPDANIVIDKGPASKELIAKVDLVVLGGGGIFYDDCFYNSQNYCQYLLYAQEYGIKSCAIGIGAQGILSEFGIELYNQALNRSEFIMVRDKISEDILINRVMLNKPVILNRDVVFSMKTSIDDFIEIKKESKPIVLFSLLDVSKTSETIVRNKYRNNQEECLKFLNEKFDLKCFVQSADDLPFYQTIKKKYNCEIISLDYAQTRSVISIYQQADLIITSRLHGFIFAALAQVPVIPVTFESPRTKLGGVINNYLPSAKFSLLPLNEYSLYNLKEKIDIFMQNPKQLIVDCSELQENKRITSKIKHEIKQKIGNL